MHLRNKTILITGGTSGFGLEFAKRFLDLGNTVIITGRNKEKLDETKIRFPRIKTYQSDVSSPEDIQRLCEQVTYSYPDLSIIINNAGIMRRIVLHDKYDLTDITQEVEIDLMGPIRMVQSFLPHLKKHKDPAIVNVTSGIALAPFPIAPVYSASKAGLRAYTKALRVQLKDTNVKVIELIAPGSTTPLNDKFFGEKGSSAGARIAPEKIVDVAIKGMEMDKEEIYPGLSKMLPVLSKVVPGLLLKQAGKTFAAEMKGIESIN
jgi:uncharacterized oxidoreductase